MAQSSTWCTSLRLAFRSAACAVNPGTGLRSCGWGVGEVVWLNWSRFSERPGLKKTNKQNKDQYLILKVTSNVLLTPNHLTGTENPDPP